MALSAPKDGDLISYSIAHLGKEEGVQKVIGENWASPKDLCPEDL
ncbi:MAG: hypothetical protein MAG431_00672 [Chloroflexi bacterium]|nr:hypothetical protein [Chloroflexota bacterium]